MTIAYSIFCGGLSSYSLFLCLTYLDCALACCLPLLPLNSNIGSLIICARSLCCYACYINWYMLDVAHGAVENGLSSPEDTLFLLDPMGVLLAAACTACMICFFLTPGESSKSETLGMVPPSPPSAAWEGVGGTLVTYIEGGFTWYFIMGEGDNSLAIS